MGFGGLRETGGGEHNMSVPFGGADTEFLNRAMKTAPFTEKPGAGCAER